MDDPYVTCSVEEFIEHYMPFVPPDAHVERFISQKIQQNSAIFSFRDEEPGSVVFTKYSDPADIEDVSWEKRATYYEDLACIAREVGAFDAPPERARNDMHYFHCPAEPELDRLDDDIKRVDACFRSGQGELDDIDIAVGITQEIWQGGSRRVRLNEHLPCVNLRIMREDPRRMFIFGMTIYTTQVVLWHQSRSHSAVSSEFNFFKEPRRLIQVFMAFMFATREELGYDPMVTRLSSDGAYTYEIPSEHGGSRFFRTNNSLDSHSSSRNMIADRITRVWAVTEVNQSGCPIREGQSNHVLKDVTIRADARTEGDIQKEVLNDIEAFFKSDDDDVNEDLRILRETHEGLVKSGRYKDYFLTIVTDHVGQTTLSEAPHSKEVDKFDLFYHEVYSMHVPKKQYRIVFKEECRPVRRVRTLGKIVDTLSATLIPLQLLLGAGWVHRDISCGNILVYETNGKSQVKLADFEHAKHFPPPEGTTYSDPILGTYEYMPTEILQQRNFYEYYSEVFLAKQIEYRKSITLEQLVEDIEKGTVPKRTAAERRRDLVFHNHQHDLESLWWIFIRVITTFVQHEDSNEWAYDIFENYTGRKEVFQDYLEDDLTRVLPPKLVVPFASIMEALRQVLYACFICREQEGLADEKSSYVLVYQCFAIGLEGLRKRREEWEATELGRRYPNVEPEEAKQKRALHSSDSGGSCPRSTKRTRVEI